MPRIRQLPSLAAADNADEIAIVDVSASTTKKITRGDLLKAPLPTNSVTTAAMADSAVTAAKIDFTTFKSGEDVFIQRGNAALNYQTSNTSGGFTTITFPKVFNSAPTVLLTPTGAVGHVVEAHVSTATTSNVIILGRTTSASTITGAVNWVAIGS